MAAKIFLSHSAQDKAELDKIIETTKRLGFHLYLYEHDLQPGASVADKVKKEISESSLFVVLLTKKSQYSAYVQQEIGFAEGANKPIVPLVENGVKERNLAMLVGREYVEFDSSNPEKGVAKLRNYLTRHEGISKDDVITFLLVLSLIITGLALALFLLERRKNRKSGTSKSQ